MAKNWKIILIWFLTITIIIVASKFITWVFISKIINSHSTVIKLEEQYQNRQKFEKDLTAISKNNEIEIVSQKWSYILPETDYQGAIFEVMVDDLAKAHEIKVLSIATEKAAKKPTGVTLPAEIEAYNFNFSGSGTYDSVVAFMIDTNRLSRLHNFRRLSIKPATDGSTYSLTFGGEVYKIKGTPTYADLANFDFYEKLKTKTAGLIEFTPPTTENVPIGKDNPFQQ